MNKILNGILAAAICAAVSANTDAAQQSTAFDVTVTVGQGCSVTATPVSFAGYDGTAAAATGDVTVTCPQGDGYNIALDAGQHFDGSTRRMADGGGNSFLGYSLRQAGTSSEWGDSDYDNTYAAGTSLADSGNGVAQPHAVNGTVPSGQNPAAVTHSDAVTVTVYY